MTLPFMLVYKYPFTDVAAAEVRRMMLLAVAAASLAASFGHDAAMLHLLGPCLWQAAEEEFDDTFEEPAHSHLPLWIPYGPPQALVYAIFYGCATLGLLFGSGYVLRIETELKELLEVKAESVGFSKKGKARLSELQLSHSFCARHACTHTRTSQLAHCFCARHACTHTWVQRKKS
jgi:hypothetical protein